ncbi:hypothetical protein J3661_000741 [Salmonella enterica subsp. enterica serovar 13,23:i:-]|nr:hypothetical protein [Salmonella enterica subsp. enterica serovar 13,23:i:-]
MMAKRGFFNLGKAVDDVSKADGIADTGLASLSLVGKGLFNVAREGANKSPNAKKRLCK